MEGINPLNLLKIKESMINGDIQLNRINYLILSRYIELLDVRGKLSDKPLKNFLSKEDGIYWKEHLFPPEKEIKRLARITKNPSDVDSVEHLIGGLIKHVYGCHQDLWVIWNDFKKSLRT